MSFEDFAAKMKARKASADAQAENKPYDFEESYRLRAKMLGVLLKDAREAAARTVEDCARLLQVAPELIEQWEYGDSAPSLPQLELLAYYLDVPVSHFWGMETLKTSRSGQQSSQPEYVRLRDKMIGALLRQAREEAGSSIEELSEISGIPAEDISSFELGELSPPMHQLAVLAGGVDKNVSHFLETSSQIGELLALREAWKHFADLPEDTRNFVADPINIGFVNIAVMLSKMPAEQLRQVGASILDITM